MAESKQDSNRDKFFAVKQSLLTKAENEINDDVEQVFLRHFKQFVAFYNPMKQDTFPDISSYEFNNALRLIFNALREHNNVQVMMKLTHLTKKYFEEYDTGKDEWAPIVIQGTLKLLQKEYMDKLHLEYTTNIKPCNIYDLYNAINDMERKLVLDFSSEPQFNKMHIEGAINVDISYDVNDGLLFDSFGIIEIYCYYHHDDDDFKEHHNNFKLAENIQHVIWKNTMNIIPFYVCEKSFNTFDTIYPFFCERKSDTDYPNQIINDKLFLGDLAHAKNDLLLKQLHITHIVNCTPNDYQNEIVKCKDRYIQISINDAYFEQIDIHFEKAYQFIYDALQYDGNKVLVHCTAGISRSSTIIISYLMKRNHITADDAFKFVKSKRSIIQPNSGFMEQLQKYEITLEAKQ